MLFSHKKSTTIPFFQNGIFKMLRSEEKPQDQEPTVFKNRLLSCMENQCWCSSDLCCSFISTNLLLRKSCWKKHCCCQKPAAAVAASVAPGPLSNTLPSSQDKSSPKKSPLNASHVNFFGCMLSKGHVVIAPFAGFSLRWQIVTKD